MARRLFYGHRFGLYVPGNPFNPAAGVVFRPSGLWADGRPVFPAPGLRCRQLCGFQDQHGEDIERQLSLATLPDFGHGLWTACSVMAGHGTDHARQGFPLRGLGICGGFVFGDVFPYGSFRRIQ